MVLAAINELGYYRVCWLQKVSLKIIFVIIPIIITIFCIIDVMKIITKPDEAKNTPNIIIRRIISGIIIFMIPSLINYFFTSLVKYDDYMIVKYYEGASREKIKEMEELAKKEELEEKNKRQAEMKVLGLEREEEKRKQREASEEQRQHADDDAPPSGQDTQDPGTATDDGSQDQGTQGGDGSFGSVTVKNGVFYIPNKRATSNADIPKQSGKYGLNPIFWSRLEKLINDAAKQGYKITVSSGWRPYSTQKSKWDSSSRPCSERANWVACPGGSRHGFGIAADLKFNGSSCSGNWDCNAAAKWVHNNAGKYGLKFRMSWEPWHIEPAQVQGGKFGKCTAKC